jgi:hypothetical protein
LGAVIPHPHRRVGPVDHEREEEVHDGRGDDRQPHRPADRDADARGPALGVVAVVAVDQDDHHRERDDLEVRVEDVADRKEQVEVVVVRAAGQAVEQRDVQAR